MVKDFVSCIFGYQLSIFNYHFYLIIYKLTDLLYIIIKEYYKIIYIILTK